MVPLHSNVMSLNGCGRTLKTTLVAKKKTPELKRNKRSEGADRRACSCTSLLTRQDCNETFFRSRCSTKVVLSLLFKLTNIFHQRVSLSRLFGRIGQRCLQVGFAEELTKVSENLARGGGRLLEHWVLDLLGFELRVLPLEQCLKRLKLLYLRPRNFQLSALVPRSPRKHERII